MTRNFLTSAFMSSTALIITGCGYQPYYYAPPPPRYVILVPPPPPPPRIHYYDPRPQSVIVYPTPNPFISVPQEPGILQQPLEPPVAPPATTQEQPQTNQQIPPPAQPSVKEIGPVIKTPPQVPQPTPLYRAPRTSFLQLWNVAPA